MPIPIIERILNNRQDEFLLKTVPGKKRRCLPMRISEEKNICNKTNQMQYGNESRIHWKKG